MKVPFNIFPKIGYKNSQFQIVASVENLRIDIYDHKKMIASVFTNDNYGTLLTGINSIGKLVAKCSFNNELFEQEFEIKNALRLGSSEFKEAFVFDDNEYSFFLMKDRLLLYDEKKKILLTENHYSPTEIHKINKSNYLFVTKIGCSTSGIINLGIYNIDTFSIVSELLNDYREIKIQPDKNKIWLYNIELNSIICFKLVEKINIYFVKVKEYTGSIDYFLINFSQNILINFSEKLLSVEFNNLHNSIEIPKLKNNAIDKLGNLYIFEGKKLIFKNFIKNISLTVQLSFDLNLEPEDFIFIGNNLVPKSKISDISNKVEVIKGNIISSIPKKKTYHYHRFSKSKRILETFNYHNIYPTDKGIFVVQKEDIKEVVGIEFEMHHGKWKTSTMEIESHEASLYLFNSNKCKLLLKENYSFEISEYLNSMLLVNYDNTEILFIGGKKIISDKNSMIQLIAVDDISYFLIISNKESSLYRTTNLDKPILDQIRILNTYSINQHQILWYSNTDNHISEKKNLYAFDLKTCSNLPIDEIKVLHSLSKDYSDFQFDNRYALSSSQIVFNPISLEIRDSIVGRIDSCSKRLSKVISYRNNTIYLSVFNFQSRKYELSKIPINELKYQESYLSPNGNFLVLKNENNQYVWFDIEKNETIKFNSENFLAFKNDGSLIVEQDKTRAVKILDPITFKDITPSNYHYFRFLSPDGKLYAQLSFKVRHLNKLNNKVMTANELNKLRRELDAPSSINEVSKKNQVNAQIKRNREQIFEKFKREFNDLGIEDCSCINTNIFIKMERYIEIGIVGTEVSTEVLIPEDLKYYNYSAFSYDNKYFGYVGKQDASGGLIYLSKIDFDEAKLNFKITNSYQCRRPDMASWVCGFSKTGYFATYDSKPNTYTFEVNDDLFSIKTNDFEIKENESNLKNFCTHSHQNWNIIYGKNFLCFSPTGNFLALSEQGYDPISLGGYGHQESNMVYITRTISPSEIIYSFSEHGDMILNSKTKKVTFVAFSEDEKKLMTLSSDGVVIVRDLNLEDPNDGN